TRYDGHDRCSANCSAKCMYGCTGSGALRSHRYTEIVLPQIQSDQRPMDRYVRRAVMDMQAARDELISAIGEIGTDDWHRFVPYGSRTLRDLLAHLATADQRWA